MTRPQPHILEREGKPAFAVLPIEDYEAMRHRLEDLEDLVALREAERTNDDTSGRPLNEVMQELGLDTAPSADDEPGPL